VLDIFRATSSMITAISNGCRSIIPVSSIEDAYRAAEQLAAPLLAGERQSIRIEGFHFGNSPFEFSVDKVRDKTIVMTTTNGTIAIKTAEHAFLTLLGSFINARAVCQAAKRQNRDILLICAGTDGMFSLEDSLCAGLLVDIINTDGSYALTDAALGVHVLYKGPGAALGEIAGKGRNGKRLADLGLQKEIDYCLRADSVTAVPVYREGKITACTL
jgi:2-phosphosulfolactate phosphatase